MDEDFVIFTENIASDLTSADISKRLKKKKKCWSNCKFEKFIWTNQHFFFYYNWINSWIGAGNFNIHRNDFFFLIRHASEVGRNSTNKKKKYFLLSNHNFVEKLVLVFGFTKGKQMSKSDFVTKFAAVIITVALN